MVYGIMIIFSLPQLQSKGKIHGKLVFKVKGLDMTISSNINESMKYMQGRLI